MMIPACGSAGILESREVFDHAWECLCRELLTQKPDEAGEAIANKNELWFSINFPGNPKSVIVSRYTFSG